MNPPNPAVAGNRSVLQESFQLGDLLDLDSFRDVCASYAVLFQIGLKIFDAQRELLVDVKGASADFCAYLFQFPQAKIQCTKEVTTIRALEVGPGEMVAYDCFTGLRYLVAGLGHEGSPIGKVVYGPFLPADRQAKSLPSFGEKFNAELAAKIMGKARKVGNDVAERVVKNLVQTIEVMLYIGYKHALTSRMHVEAVTVSFNELKEKNRELRESYQKLKELDRLKSSFLATVSHELRTPLTSVIGYSEMLIEGLAGELNPEQREYISTIMEKGEQLLSLISSLLDFSKIESGNLRLNYAPGDVVAIAQNAVSTVAPLARKVGVAVRVDAQKAQQTALVDAEKIRQVFVNLLGNAVKFNRQNGTVTIRIDTIAFARPTPPGTEDSPFAAVESKEEWLRIMVSDTGVGIPTDKLTRIFESFYQVDGSSTREFGGTGLGLAIVKSLVEGHQGVVEVESQEGIGSTFTVMLPLAPPA